MVSEVMEHLMFHKALLGSDVELDHYIELAEELENGAHIAAKDPVEKAITIIFELVMNEKINPWNIDLEKFAKIYMERVKKEKDIDFIIAGKIVYMAWDILKRKSEQVLDKMEVEEEQYDDFFGMDISEDFYSYDDGYVEEPTALPELVEPVRREESAPVSLFDLISAMNEVKREIEKKKKKKKIREKFKFNLEEKVHKEDLEEEIMEVWERLAEVRGDEVALSVLYDGTREDFIKVFISLLFLEKFGKVELEQYVPYDGEIYIKIKVPEELRGVEFEPIPTISIAQL